MVEPIKSCAHLPLHLSLLSHSHVFMFRCGSVCIQPSPYQDIVVSVCIDFHLTTDLVFKLTLSLSSVLSLLDFSLILIGSDFPSGSVCQQLIA